MGKWTFLCNTHQKTTNPPTTNPILSDYPDNLLYQLIPQNHGKRKMLASVVRPTLKSVVNYQS